MYWRSVLPWCKVSVIKQNSNIQECGRFQPFLTETEGRSISTEMLISWKCFLRQNLDV